MKIGPFGHAIRLFIVRRETNVLKSVNMAAQPTSEADFDPSV